MKYRLFGLLLLYGLFIGSLGFESTGAYFSDSATSSSNTFTAADEFPIQPGDVVINEIMWMGTQVNASDEWLELRNMTSNSIDLSGWVIENLGPGTNSVTLPQGASVSANGFFLIANDSAAAGAHNVAPDFQTNVSIANSPSEQLVLRTSSGGTTVDTADDTSGGWFAGVNGTGQNPINKSMERNTTPGDGTISTNWHTASSSTNMDLTNTDLATPKAANSSEI